MKRHESAISQHSPAQTRASFSIRLLSSLYGTTREERGASRRWESLARFVGLTTGICISAVVLFGPPAVAQERTESASERDSGNALEEIVVTAQRREQSIQDVPVSISAFSADDLESMGATSLQDLTAFTTNFSFLSSDTGELFRIRAVGSSDASLFFDPGVGIFVDGVYMPRMRGMDIDIVGIERIEVLRGPQGTLFGKNTIGGAINIVSARPGEAFSGQAEITTGRYDRLDGKLSVSGPIVPGTLAGSMAVVVRNRDGYGVRRDFDTGENIDETGDQESFGGRASLSWTPNEDLDVLLSVDASTVDQKGGVHNLVETFLSPPIGGVNALTDPDYGSWYITPDLYTSYANGPNYYRFDSWGAALNVRRAMGAWALRSITSFRHQKAQYGQDPDDSPVTILGQTFFEPSDKFSQEFQLSGLASDDRLNWVAGLYYEEEDAMMQANTLVLQPLYEAVGVDASTTLRIWSDSWSAAAYGQGTYMLTDKLSMTAGARYSKDSKELARERERINTGGIYIPRASFDDKWSAISGRFGFEYRATDEVMTYISAARGYKAGGINAAGTSTFEFTSFDPEYLWTYEVGLRSDWLENRLRLNASVFFSDYTDMQFRSVVSDPEGNPINLVDNVASAEVTGLEVELRAVPAPGWQFSAAAGYMNAEYKSIDPGTPGVTEDMKFPDTPKWSMSLSGQYTHPLQHGADLVVRADYSYTAEQQRAINNTPYLVQDAHPMLNARLAYLSSGGQWEVAVFGTNLTGEKILLTGWDLRSLGFIDSQYGPPEQWGISLKYNF